MDIQALMSIDSVIFKLVIALFLGAFIGLRREMDLQKEGSEGFVGFRTMPLIVLLGAISTMIPQIPFLPAICLLGVLGFLTIAYYNGVFKLQLIGLTSEFATIIMFLVGIFIGNGEYIIAILLTVVTGVLTGFKNQFHSFARNISTKEWSGALQLLILSAAVFPFLPHEAIDPWGVIIPFDIWLLVIFVSGIGFLGYFFSKYMSSSKSILATSLFGSLASSTAVVTALAFQAKKNKKIPARIFVLAVLVATGTMLMRTIFEILVIAGPDTRVVVVVPLCMFGATVFLFLWNVRLQKNNKEEIEIDYDIKSPLELLPALKFGAFFVVVLLSVALGKEYFGDYGVLITAVFSSFVDVDAALLSSLQAEKLGEITKNVSILAVTIAVILNTLVKVMYILILSRKDVAKGVFVVIGLISLTGLAGYFII